MAIMAARALLAAAAAAAALSVVLVAASSSAPAPASGGGDAFPFTEHDLASEEALSALYERWLAHHEGHTPLRHGAGAGDEDEKARRRFSAFKENARFVHEFNKEPRSYTLGLNHLSDMSSEELDAAGYGGCVSPENNSSNKNNKNNSSSKSTRKKKINGVDAWLEPPAQKDWRVEGAVAGIKNQNPCSSCWAFSATAAVESLVAIKTGSLVALSEQQVIDCHAGKPADSCSGGLMSNAFRHASSTGLTSQEHYPYERSQGPCEVSLETPIFARISGHAFVPQNDGAAMLRRVALQPVAATIHVSRKVLLAYRGGVFRGPCGSNPVWHSVAVVGYGSHGDDGDYWVVRNSWGTRWGEGGYMRISRDGGGKAGVCEILSSVLYPLWGKNLI